MEDKLKSFLQEIQGKISEAISMCGGEEEEMEEQPEAEESGEAPEPEGMPMEKSLRKEKLKLRLKKELGA